jgi:hypothetical protein
LITAASASDSHTLKLLLSLALVDVNEIIRDETGTPEKYSTLLQQVLFGAANYDRKHACVRVLVDAKADMWTRNMGLLPECLVPLVRVALLLCPRERRNYGDIRCAPLILLRWSVCLLAA